MSYKAINVQQFGAVGDGVVDDTTAISNAITAAGVEGSVYVPKGTYLVSSGFTLLDKQNIYGDGRESSKITTTSAITMFTLANRNHLRDLHLIGADNVGSKGIKDQVGGPTRALLTDLDVDNFEVGIEIEHLIISRITDCFVENCSGAGIKVLDTAGTINSVYMLGGELQANGVGLQIEGDTKQFNLYNVAIEGNTTAGVQMLSPTANTIVTNFFGCWFELNGNHHIECDAGWYTSTVFNCRFDDNSQPIEIWPKGGQKATTIRIEKCFFADDANFANNVEIAGGAEDIQIIDCTLGPVTGGVLARATYTDSGTRTYFRDFQTLATAPVNVRDYATGDGTTDDTAGVRSAIQDAQSRGVPCHFPAGTYDLATWTQETTTADLVITGAGRDLVTITGPDTTTDFLAVAPGDNVSLSGVKLDTWQYVCYLNSTAGTAHADLAIRQCSANNVQSLTFDTDSLPEGIGIVEIEDNEVTAGLFAAAVIRAETFKSCRISGNYVDDISSSTKSCYGFLIGKPSNVEHQSGPIEITNNRIHNVDSSFATGAAHGILAYGRRVRILGNDVRHVSDDDNTECYGIYTKVHAGVIANNTLRNAGSSNGCIRIKGADSDESTASDPYGYGAVIQGNSILITNSDRIYHGIRCQSDRALITGNYIEGKASTTFTAAVSDVITSTDHRLETNDIVEFETTGTLPAGLSTATPYWVTVTDEDTFTVSATKGGATVDITDTGTGTHTIDTSWLSRGIVAERDKTTISNNNIHNVYYENSCAAIEVNAANDCSVTGNTIDTVTADANWSMGVYCAFSSGGPYKNLEITNNRIYNVVGTGSDYAVQMAPSSGITVTDIKIDGNTFSNCSKGLRFNEGTANNGTYSQNRFENVSQPLQYASAAVVRNWRYELDITVATTNSSATTLYAFQTDADSVNHCEGIVTAARTDTYAEVASYHKAATFKNDGGTLTKTGTTTTIHEAEDAAGWQFDIINSGTQAVFQVTGAASTNIDWQGKLLILANG